MLVTRDKRPVTRTLRCWAISVPQGAGAIKECEEHGWMQDRADPHARERERASDIAREERPPGVSPHLGGGSGTCGRLLWNRTLGFGHGHVGDMSGVQLAQYAKRKFPHINVVVIYPVVHRPTFRRMLRFF